MDKIVYENYCLRWKKYQEIQEAYKRELDKWDNDTSAFNTPIEIRKALGIEDFGELDSGPFTIFYKEDIEDLKNPKFILPGMGKSFLELSLWGENEKFIKDIETESYYWCNLTGEFGKIVGFGYDDSDYYYVIRPKDKRDCGAMVNIQHETLGNPDRSRNFGDAWNRFMALKIPPIVSLTTGTTDSIKDIKRILKKYYTEQNYTVIIYYMNNWTEARKLKEKIGSVYSMRKHEHSKERGEYVYVLGYW